MFKDFLYSLFRKFFRRASEKQCIAFLGFFNKYFCWPRLSQLKIFITQNSWAGKLVPIKVILVSGNVWYRFYTYLSILSWDPRAAHPWAIDGPSHSHRWPIDGPPTFLPWPIDGPSMGHRWDHSEFPSMGYRNFCQGIKNTFLRDFYEKKKH